MRVQVLFVCVLGCIAGCAQSTPAFTSGLDRNTTLGELTRDQLAQFCQAQATYVFNQFDPAGYRHAHCLDSAVELSATPDACRASLASCTSAAVQEPWVYDCQRVDPEPVGHREDCVTETVTVTWPAWESRLDCSMAGDHDRIRAALEGSESEACITDI